MKIAAEAKGELKEFAELEEGNGSVKRKVLNLLPKLIGRCTLCDQ